MTFYTSSATSKLWRKQKLEVSNASYNNTTGILLSKFKTVKYILTLYGSSKVRSLEVNVNNVNGALQDTITNVLGIMDIAIDTEINSGKMSIKITNNENFDIKSDITYLILGTS